MRVEDQPQLPARCEGPRGIVDHRQPDRGILCGPHVEGRIAHDQRRRARRHSLQRVGPAYLDRNPIRRSRRRSGETGGAGFVEGEYAVSGAGQEGAQGSVSGAEVDGRPIRDDNLIEHIHEQSRAGIDPGPGERAPVRGKSQVEIPLMSGPWKIDSPGLRITSMEDP